VAKPLLAKSHELSLAYDPTSLTKLEPPLVLQEFVNHGTFTESFMLFLLKKLIPVFYFGF
jgi:hypothetical protein